MNLQSLFLGISPAVQRGFHHLNKVAGHKWFRAFSDPEVFKGMNVGCPCNCVLAIVYNRRYGEAMSCARVSVKTENYLGFNAGGVYPVDEWEELTEHWKLLITRLLEADENEDNTRTVHNRRNLKDSKYPILALGILAPG